MTFAYVDSSCLVAIAFGESGHQALGRRLRRAGELLSSPLLEAEVRSALAREGVAKVPPILERISWILPDRALGAEIGRVLEVGRLRGADLWHLASALFVSPDPRELTFLTLDREQARIATALGFAT